METLGAIPGTNRWRPTMKNVHSAPTQAVASLRFFTIHALQFLTHTWLCLPAAPPARPGPGPARRGPPRTPRAGCAGTRGTARRTAPPRRRGPASGARGAASRRGRGTARAAPRPPSAGWGGGKGEREHFRCGCPDDYLGGLPAELGNHELGIRNRPCMN